MLMKRLPFVRRLTKATILYKFSDRSITSAAFMLSYDFAFIEIPIAAACKQGMSLRPKINKILTIAHHNYTYSIIILDIFLSFFDPLLLHKGTMFGM